jgi:prepilin-type N-terminal cleavage/methylation domain-containing protein
MLISPTGNSGFTLLELLVAITISTVVLTAVYGSFNAAITAQKRSEKALRPLCEARYLFSFFKKDLGQLPLKTKPDNIKMEAGLCKIPFKTEDGIIADIIYKLDNRGQVIRQISLPDEKTDINAVIATGVKSVLFDKKTGKNSYSMLVSIEFVMFSKKINNRESKEKDIRYYYAIIIEKKL